ncbi:IS200/IS605 family transposase [Pseudochryseolinea flava]|uniref:IS200/IS605 family transposase n=1 Tax=Pseudochryseolinea flava TaxID=2059302 RepID=UPI001FE2572D|nr:IS200/IS605 family transposase [Pseudochryseolinea flava]
MSFTKIWVHVVWTTKYRNVTLSDSLIDLLINHIKYMCHDKQIDLRCINGYADHMHALLKLRATQNLADVVKQIKGESAFWINNNKLTTNKFQWQTDYYAITVSPGIVPVVTRYIKNQKQKHRHRVLSTFLKRGGFTAGTLAKRFTGFKPGETVTETNENVPPV